MNFLDLKNEVKLTECSMYFFFCCIGDQGFEKYEFKLTEYISFVDLSATVNFIAFANYALLAKIFG